MTRGSRVPFLALVLAAVALAAPARSAAQARGPADRAEPVTLDQSDGITLTGRLVLPPGKGPFPGVVVLTLAGSNDLVARLNGLGFAVLLPNRRGLGGAPELLLRATFDRLVEDVRTAVTYLRSRPEVNDAVIGLIGQGGETMVTTLAAAALDPAFVVLVGAYGLPGDETFRLEQDFLAAAQGYDASKRAALDTLVTDLDEVVSTETSESLREYRIQGLVAELRIGLPRNPASLPPDEEGQVHFFSSPWWRDFFMFDAIAAFSGVRSPLLALLGQGDPTTPYQRQLPGIRAGLSRAPTRDATLCILPGLVQHQFSATTLSTMEQWIRARMSGAKVVPNPGVPRPTTCLDERQIGVEPLRR